jgi:4-hydroxy-3-polyprenylbenzoate decarboxylase
MALKRLRSLREFIDALKAIGEVQPIDKEVDWNLEIGAVTRRSYELRAPAPLFNTIKGIDRGLRVLGAPGGLSAQPEFKYARIALALGLPPNAPARTIIEGLAAARGKRGIPPRVVPTGPCKENIMVGPKVDLLKFPTPLIHASDGGRYIQTYGMNIVRTPDGSWTNWSINRMMLVDRNRLACLIPPNQHLGIINAKWKALGKPTPIVVAFGVEPALPFVGGMSAPEGVDESHLLGAYFDEPIEVVKGESADLPVPATAEIVVEGHISHEDVAIEGPMGEYPGYLDLSQGKPKPVLHVSAVTYRNDAILPVVAAGPPVEEDHTGWGMPHASMCLYDLQQAGLPVTGAWMVLESACHWMLIAVSPDWHEKTGLSSKDFSKRVGDVIFPTKTGFGVPKIIVVEDDFDFTDVTQVVWAFATRAHPHHGEVYFENRAQNNLPVFLEPEEKFSYHTTKVVHNCLVADRFPKDERPVAADLAHGWPPEIQRSVLDGWRSYGYR